MTAELEAQKNISNEALAKVDLLNQQLLSLRRQVAALNEALGASEKKDAESQTRIKDLGARLNAALARQVQELQRYRSDFFGRLRELLKQPQGHKASSATASCSNPRCCFPSGSEQLTPEGLAAMDQLATAIIELERQIPKEINWALQVDGHTDIRPIASPQFPSNWDLSTARAISVVRYLVSRGVRPDAPRRRRLRRVPAADARHRRGEPAAEPAHRAEADEQVAGVGLGPRSGLRGGRWR